MTNAPSTMTLWLLSFRTSKLSIASSRWILFLSIFQFHLTLLASSRRSSSFGGPLLRSRTVARRFCVIGLMRLCSIPKDMIVVLSSSRASTMARPPSSSIWLFPMMTDSKVWFSRSIFAIASAPASCASHVFRMRAVTDVLCSMASAMAATDSAPIFWPERFTFKTALVRMVSRICSWSRDHLSAMRMNGSRSPRCVLSPGGGEWGAL